MKRFLLFLACAALLTQAGILFHRGGGPSLDPRPLPPARIGQRTFLLNLPAEDIGLDDRDVADLHRNGLPQAAILRVGPSESALVLAPGSEASFRTEIPPESRLRFGVWRGIPAESRTALTLAVIARSPEGVDRILWRETIRKAGARRSRIEVELDLGEVAGSIIVLRSSVPTDRRPGGEPDGESPTPGKRWPGFVSPVLECAGRVVFPTHTRNRNVVVFLVDTLRADHLGLYGYEERTSPNIDRLGAKSLVYLQAQAVASWTKPSVASLLTSRYPSQHGASNYANRLNDSEVTLAHIFRGAGYRTAAIGVNGFVFNPLFNFHGGFEDFFQVIGREGEHGDTSRLVVDQVIDWLDRHHEEPFFLYVQVIDPHTPYAPPTAFEDRFLPTSHAELVGPGSSLLEDFEGRSREEITSAELESIVALYDAEIAFTDAELGRLTEHMQRLGIWEETTFVVCSDHGEEFLDHGDWGHGETLYQEQLHVPLIVKPPRSAEIEPERIERPVSLLDVAPTLCELVGIPAAIDSFQGTSLLGVGRRREDPMSVHELERFKPTYAVRFGDLKYIRRLGSRPVEELYRLDRDPREQENLVDTYDRRVVARLRDALQEHLRDVVPEGVVIEVTGDGTPAVVTGRIESRGVLWNGNLLSSERAGDSMGEAVVRDGTMSLSFRLQLDEWDRFDGIVFSVAEPARFRLELEVDGRPLAPSSLRIGASADPAPDAYPFELDATDPAILVEERPAPMTDESGLVCRIWRRATEAVTLPAADLEALQALGYLGGE